MAKYNMEQLTKESERLLKERGVEKEDIAELVMFLQKKYCKALTIEDCIENVDAVLAKREVAHAILTGIAIDKMVEKDQVEEPLHSIILEDAGLYGIDEILPLSIVNIYGSIGLTNYGFLDKEKVGILKELDEKDSGQCNTFLDDLVAAIAAAAASRIAHAEFYC